MTTSLRDQLTKLGFKAPEPPPRPERRPPQGAAKADAGASRPPQGKRSGGEQERSRPPRNDRGRGKPASSAPSTGSAEEIDLARAYALRTRTEREEQQRLERERQAEAARRREARLGLHTLMQSASLNNPQADLPRHFEHAGKIRRIYVTAEQLKSLNGGELAVVAAGGRYHLVSLEHAQAAQAFMPECLALKVDPNAQEGGEDYVDPRFQVPDDLVW
jgi:uncharacterized protein YaiL (DUF2058 family)